MITQNQSYSTYPFGMIMSGRNESAGSDYRYGFQGQEMDDEIKGKGNSVNYKYRMHDPRVGRFFAVDPLASQFPHYAPYSFSGNRVIHKIELEGMEDIYFMDSFENTNGSGEETITRIESTEIGYKILESFRNTEPGVIFDYLPDDMQGMPNLGYDIFVIGTMGSGGLTSTTGRKTTLRTYDDDGVLIDVSTVNVWGEIEKAREAGEGELYELWKARLGEEILESEELGETIKNQRGIIIVEIGDVGAFAEEMGGVQGAVDYAVVHEIGSHAIKTAIGVMQSVVDDHEDFSGIKSEITLQGGGKPGTPAEQFQDQYHNASEGRDYVKPIKVEVKKIDTGPIPTPDW